MRVVAEAAHALGRAVAAITSFTGVECVILSGEGVALADVAPDALDRARRDHRVASTTSPPPVVQPMDFLEWARGAAVVAIQAVFP